MILDLGLSNVFVENEVDAAVQELDILFNTENTELIGNTFFGTNFEQFLWELSPAPNDVKKYITDKIMNFTFFANKLDVYVHVEVIKGEVRNIYQVFINIEDPTTKEKQVKLYQFR